LKQIRHGDGNEWFGQSSRVRSAPQTIAGPEDLNSLAPNGLTLGRAGGHLVRGAGSIESRMWQMIDRATYCPIVYNTLEEYKDIVGFQRPNS